MVDAVAMSAVVGVSEMDCSPAERDSLLQVNPDATTAERRQLPTLAASQYTQGEPGHRAVQMVLAGFRCANGRCSRDAHQRWLALVVVAVPCSACFLSHSAIDAGQWQSCPLRAEQSSKDSIVSRYCTLINDSGLGMQQQQMRLGPSRSVHPAFEDASVVFSLPASRDDIGCGLSVLSPSAARSLLSNRRLLFIGDSTTQELVTELISFLEEAPLEADYTLDAWINQPPCPGLHLGYTARTFTTARFPSPALSLFNITIAMAWNGHPSECANLGDYHEQLGDAIWERISTASHICMQRREHLELLANITALPNTWLLQDDSAAAREAAFQALQDMATPYDATARYLGAEAEALRNVSSRALLESGLPLVRRLVAPCAEWMNEFELDPPYRLYVTAPPMRSFHHVVYNTGAHIVPSSAPRRAELSFLASVTAVVSQVLSRLHHNVSLRSVTWKDSAPASVYPALQLMNAASRSVAAAWGRRMGQSDALDVWPVGELLSDLHKQDVRHCSYKDVQLTDWWHRERRTRSVFCRTAVQLLLQQLQAAQNNNEYG
jgi:hypothetical protein